MIDSHIHFWDLRYQRNQWVHKTRLPEQVTPNQVNDQSPANAFVHIEAHDPDCDALCEVNWLESLKLPFQLKFVAYAPFDQSNTVFLKTLKRFASNRHIVGVRDIMAADSMLNYTPGQNKKIIDLSGKLNALKQQQLIFEAQLYPHQLLNNADTIAHSDVTMALEHMGLPVWQDAKRWQQWKQAIVTISQMPHWFVKLSGHSLLNLPFEGLMACLDWLFTHIPCHRLCWGSNYPVCFPNQPDQWYRLVDQALSLLVTKHEKNNIFHQTAANLYQFH